MNNDLTEKRDHIRSKLYYPLDLTLFSPKFLDRSFSGYIKNLSLHGACIQLEDSYERFEKIEQEDSRVELEIDVPQGERISFDTGICWIKKNSDKKSISFFIGLEFNELSDSNLEQIDRLSRIKKTDTQMLHALFDQHLKQISTP